MTATQQTSRYRDRILSRDDVEHLVADGRKVVIIDGAVLKVDAWLPYHPGGDKAILHMVGRDASLEVHAFHSLETQDLMKKYQIGKIEGQWRDFVPPIQDGTFRFRVDIESGNPDEPDSSESSGEPSPMFDKLRRRQKQSSAVGGQNSSISTSSSATSLSSLAIDEVDGYSTLQSRLKVRTTQEQQDDMGSFPSLDAATQATIISKYQALDDKVRGEGLYDCSYKDYAIEAARYTFLALSSYFLLRSGYYIASAVCLGMFWHQLTFTVHDAGHMGITHDYHIDSCIGIFIADFLGGLSCCWWKRNHNVHHIVTNSPEHDPDIQHMPFFAITPRFFSSLKSTYYDRIMSFDAMAQFTLKYQHYLYYPLLTFGRFNLYALSWQYIFGFQGPRKGPAWWHRYLEMVGQVFFWYWFGYLVVYKSTPSPWTRVLFVLISHATTTPVHVQITLSHFAMSTSDLGVAESFPQRMLRTTMDVDCPQWLDFFHGGLQFQAVHHLFPRMPRHNLRRAQKYVVEFCQDLGIPYTIYGFQEGNEKVLSRLEDVAKQARMLVECQRSSGLHSVLESH
nr:hypothetical protein B0A51_00666 [Rachicladosporium sp. CCFEE 5018]